LVWFSLAVLEYFFNEKVENGIRVVELNDFIYLLFI